jgi:hypothetical protein
VVWRQPFLPLDTVALNVTNITNWVLIILHPRQIIGIPPTETHKFQIFATVSCDFLWFIRNKAHHEGIILNALTIYHYNQQDCSRALFCMDNKI